MSKTLCELKKLLNHDFEAYVQLVCEPRFVCTQCGRVANKKKYLCSPEKIADRPYAWLDLALAAGDMEREAQTVET